jgi:hypothetical protein
MIAIVFIGSFLRPGFALVPPSEGARTMPVLTGFSVDSLSGN